MSCQEYRELLSAELDDELSAQEKESLLQHLSQCDACRGLRQRLQQMEKGFSYLPEAPPPPLRPRALPGPRPAGSAGAAALWSTLLIAAASAALVWWPKSGPVLDGAPLYLGAHTLQRQAPQEQAAVLSEFRSQPLYGRALPGRELAFEIQLDSHQQACEQLQLEVDYDYDNDGKVDRSEVYAPFQTDARDGWEVYRSQQGAYSHQGEIRDFTGGTVAVRLRNASGKLEFLQGASRLVLPYQLGG